MKRIDMITGILLMALSGWGFVYSGGLRGDAGTLPRLIFAALFLCGGALALLAALDKKEPSQEEKDDKKRLLWIVLSILSYILLINIGGFYLATAVYLAGTMFFFGVKSWKLLVTIPVVFDLIIFFAFEKLLTIQLPTAFFL